MVIFHRFLYFYQRVHIMYPLLGRGLLKNVHQLPATAAGAIIHNGQNVKFTKFVEILIGKCFVISLVVTL